MVSSVLHSIECFRYDSRKIYDDGFETLHYDLDQLDESTNFIKRIIDIEAQDVDRGYEGIILAGFCQGG